MDDHLRDLERRCESIRPWLRETRWPPMTYMLIPSVLEGARKLVDELRASRGPDRERALALADGIEELRRRFRRER